VDDNERLDERRIGFAIVMAMLDKCIDESDQTDTSVLGGLFSASWTQASSSEPHGAARRVSS
jgi:hypothetical protein